MRHALGTAFGVAAGALAALCGAAHGQSQNVILPPGNHVTGNSFPFNQVGQTNHQMLVSSLFANLYGGAPVRIEEMAYAPTGNVMYNAHVVIRLGYTNLGPLQLQVPVPGGGGAPNASGAMTVFYEGVHQQQVTNNPQLFGLTFVGTPFVYDPALGNLLVEVVVTDRVTGSSVSRTDGVTNSSRAWQTHGGAGGADNSALRIQFTVSPDQQGCYANCDGSTVEPILNIDDFTCFINEFAAGSALPPEQQVTHYANCDGSTVAPALNIDDFTCFINEFAAGCR